MTFAKLEELNAFLDKNPDATMMEILIPDVNGILRGKRIPPVEFETFFTKGVKSPASLSFCNCRGDFADELDLEIFRGDADQLLFPVADTLSSIGWLKSDTIQVLASFTELDRTPAFFDPRTVLKNALQPLYDLGYSAVVATEMEFYLIEEGDDALPKLKLSNVPGTNQPQPGIQYAMPEELWDNEKFLEDVRVTCVEQNIPMTTVHSEFSPGQFELNLHHVADPVIACDHAVLFKRIIKGVARNHGSSASFMAKPFDDIAGCGLHIHFSLYDAEGKNVFSTDSEAVPALSDQAKYAVGGLAETMDSAMAIFAPNANSYRRLVPGNYAPLTPNWGYNHRDVALRVPVSEDNDRRIEHRVAGADANPYLVMASIAAGIHYGITNKCVPDTMVAEYQEIEEEIITLPRQWPIALDKFQTDTILKDYLGKEFCDLFVEIRRSEWEEFSKRVSNIDYEWYLRSV